MKVTDILFLFFLALVSCSKPTPYQEMVQGKWMINHAVRQGKPTNTLNGLYFQFEKDSVYSNMELIERSEFQIQEDTIYIMAHPNFRFHIMAIDSSHMDLNGWIQETQFLLKFQKSTENANH